MESRARSGVAAGKGRLERQLYKQVDGVIAVANLPNAGFLS